MLPSPCLLILCCAVCVVVLCGAGDTVVVERHANDDALHATIIKGQLPTEAPASPRKRLPQRSAAASQKELMGQLVQEYDF